MNPRKPTKSKHPKSLRLFGAPEPEKFSSTVEGKALVETAAIHFRSKAGRNVNRLLAIEKLVLDIFQDPQAARAFAVNPEAYMQRFGFNNIKLDLNSQEVKVAMAIGDPLARQAAAKGDVNGFIDAILAQGIAPSVGLGRFVHVEALVHSSAVVYVIAAVVSFQKVVTATALPIAVVAIANPIFDKDHHMTVLKQIAKYLGDKDFSRKIASQKTEKIIEKYNQLLEKKLKP